MAAKATSNQISVAENAKPPFYACGKKKKSTELNQSKVWVEQYHNILKINNLEPLSRYLKVLITVIDQKVPW